MGDPPGTFRRIDDPQAEVDRLARDRQIAAAQICAEQRPPRRLPDARRPAPAARPRPRPLPTASGPPQVPDLLSPEGQQACVQRAAARVIERGPDPAAPGHKCNLSARHGEGLRIRQCACGRLWARRGTWWYPVDSDYARWRFRKYLQQDADLLFGDNNKPERWRWWHYLRYPVQAYWHWRNLHG